MRGYLEVTAGFLLVGLGVVGLVLPILPGWVFLIPGLVILARHYHWARRFLTLARIQFRKLKGRKPQ